MRLNGLLFQVAAGKKNGRRDVNVGNLIPPIDFDITSLEMWRWKCNQGRFVSDHRSRWMMDFVLLLNLFFRLHDYFELTT